MSARASSPDPVPSWSYAPAEYGNFGTVVASAGDVNGDGADDVIIGSPYWSSSSVSALGRAYLFLGQCGEGLALEPSWIAEGDDADGYGAFLGSDVGSAGDANADGFGDIFVLERYWSQPGSPACEPSDPNDCAFGRVHVWYGGPSGPAAAADGMALPADWTWAPSWWAEHIDGIAAGDVNGNGVGDLAVAVPDWGADHIRIFRGVATVGLPAQASQIIESPMEQAQTAFGRSMALGDIDGDGSDDLLVGAWGAYNPVADAPYAGVAYLFYGSPGGVEAAPGWTRWGDVSFEKYGAAVAIPGDMDGDGYADMAISAPASLADWHAVPLVGPKVEIFRGGSEGPADERDETLLDESWHLAPAGDVDGAASLSLPVYADLAMERRPRGPDGRPTGQEGVVVHGASSLVGEMTLVRDGVAGSQPISGAGDVNADGFDDVVVGNGWFFEPPSGETTGRAWLHPGRSSGFGVAPVEPPHCCEHPTDEEIVILKVYDIEFTGAGLVAVHQDTGDPYGAPHWLDAELDGTAETLGLDRRVPVAYVRNSVMHVEATFQFKTSPPTVNEGCLQVKGIGTDGAQLSGSVTQHGDGSIRGSFTSSMNLPNAIDSLGKYKIDWQVSRDGTAWTPIGTSSSRVYVLLAAPDPALAIPYETVADISCRSAVGCTTTACMVEKVYDEFETPADGVARKAMDGFLVADGVVMQYWATAGSDLESAIIADSQCYLAAGLLDPTASRGELNGKGTCGAWQDLFMQCAQVHGVLRGVGEPHAHVGLHEVTVTPRYPETGLIVKEHAFSDTGASACWVPFDEPGPLPQAFPFIWPGGTLQCSGAPPTSGTSCDLDGVIGQRDPAGNPLMTNPTSLFGDHALVLFNGKIFDPSYGSPVIAVPGAWSPPEALLAMLSRWERDNLAGYATLSCDAQVFHTKRDAPFLVELAWEF